MQYTGQIFPAFDELYLLIISVFNTTGNVMYFPILRVHQGAKFPHTYIHHFLP